MVLTACYTALRTKLVAASGLTSLLSLSTGIYRIEAGQDAGTKYVVMSYNRGGYTNIVQNDMMDVAFTVKGVADNAADAGSIQAAILSALHGAELTYPEGWLHVSCQHTTAFEFPEQVDRITLYHMGGIYRLRASKR
jgi:hypothetical protein